MRVASLVPSATEILCAIGGRGLLVGRSHECDYPVGVEAVPSLTGQRTRFESAAQVDREVRALLSGGMDGEAGSGLYTLDAPLLAELRPDVILTQSLCGVCSIGVETVRGVAAGMDPRPQVVSLNPTSLEGVFDDMLTVGRAVGLEREAEEEVVRLRERVYAAGDYVNPFTDGPSVAFLEWTDPLFIGGHWTPQLIERAGGRHPLNPTVAAEGAGAAAGPVGATLRMAGKSVVVPVEVLAASQPERVVVCPCGVGLEGVRREVERLREQAWWRGLPAVQDGWVALVDGSQMFNRPGPRLVEAFEWLVGWLNGVEGVMPERFPWERG